MQQFKALDLLIHLRDLIMASLIRQVMKKITEFQILKMKKAQLYLKNIN